MDTMKNIFRNLKELYWKYDKPVHLALVMALAALYFLDVNQYMYRVLIMIGLYAILALSLNIILGLTGMLSMGHAAFYSIGAMHRPSWAPGTAWAFLAQQSSASCSPWFLACCWV